MLKRSVGYCVYRGAQGTPWVEEEEWDADEMVREDQKDIAEVGRGEEWEEWEECTQEEPSMTAEAAGGEGAQHVDSGIGGKNAGDSIGWRSSWGCEKGGIGDRKGKRKRRTWVMSEQSEVSRIKMLRRMGAAEGDATVEGIERACGVPVKECSDRGVT